MCQVLAGAGESADLSRVLVLELRVQFLDLDWLAVLFDCFNNFINIGFDFLFVSVLLDANGVVVVVVFVDDDEVWGKFSDKGNVRAVAGVVLAVDEALGQILDLSDAAVLRQVSDDCAFDFVDSRYLVVFGGDLEADQDSFF